MSFNCAVHTLNVKMLPILGLFQLPARHLWHSTALSGQVQNSVACAELQMVASSRNDPQSSDTYFRSFQLQVRDRYAIHSTSC